MSNCKKNSDKIRILSSCDKPVYTSLCNSDDLATAIAAALGTGGGSSSTVTVTNPTDLTPTNNLLTQILNDEKDDYEYLILYDKQPDTTATVNRVIHGIIGDITLQVNQWTEFPITWQNIDGTPVGSFTPIPFLNQTLHNTYIGGSGDTGNSFGIRRDATHTAMMGSINSTVSLSNSTSPEFFTPNGASSVELVTGTGTGTGDASFTNVYISAMVEVTVTTQGACIPFIRVLKDNTVVNSLDLNGNPYTVAGTPQVSCGEQLVSVSNLDTIETNLDSLINKQTNATNYNEVTDGVTVTTVTGTEIVVTFFNGTGSFTLNSGTPVSLDSTRQYRSEFMDGTVVVTPDVGSDYHVSWRA